MNQLNAAPDANPGSTPIGEPAHSARFALSVLVLVGCFSVPLYDLLRFSVQSEVYSHIILVPFISLYLVWLKRESLPPHSSPDRGAALCLLIAGAFVLAGYWAATLTGVSLAREDSLALTTLSFLLFLGGVCATFLGHLTLRSCAFPLCFLVFMTPFPAVFLTSLETFLQHGSAAVALALFKSAGTAVFYQDLVFLLPGISLQVAPECSGIRSSLALFITSVLAGYFFLRTPWKCAVLTLAVIPLALLRNGLRIFTIGELCVYISPDMINSFIHRHGGPVFFIISLIPFLFLLQLLSRSDQPGKETKAKPFGV